VGVITILAVVPYTMQYCTEYTRNVKNLHEKLNKKVKQFHYRPGQALRVPGG